MMQIDTAPLSWIFPEVRTSASEAQEAISKYRSDRNDSGSLQLAISRVHQLHGGLQMLDVPGLSVLSDAIEALLSSFDADPERVTPQALDAADDALTALTVYCEELLAGSQHQPLRLYPYLRDVLKARNAERVHPSDLFFPDLSLRLAGSNINISAGSDTAQAMRSARRTYEAGLLPLLQGDTGDGCLATMRTALAEVAEHQSGGYAKSFWGTTVALLDALRVKSIPVDLNIKRLAARLNLQVKRVADGSPQVAERLFKDALYFVATARSREPSILAVHSAFRLAGSIPSDFESTRFVRIDRDLLARAKEKLAQMKGIWNQAAGAREGANESAKRSRNDAIEQFSKAAVELAGWLGRLQLTQPMKLSETLSSAMAANIAEQTAPSDSLGLEVASAILYLELLLNAVHSPDERRDERIDALVARVNTAAAGQDPGPAEPWLNEIARREQDRTTLQTLASELSAQLASIEKNLDSYFRNPADKSTIAGNDGPLGQIQGALGLLGLSPVQQAVAHIRTQLALFMREDYVPSEQDFGRMAETYGRLTLAVETFARDPQMARDRYAFDTVSGELREKVAPVAVADAIDDLQASLESALSGGMSSPGASIESAVSENQKKTVEIFSALSDAPGDKHLQADLSATLSAIRNDAVILDQPDMLSGADRALSALKNAPSGQGGMQALADAINDILPPPAPSQPVSAMLPHESSAVDAELLGIFLEEAKEVLGNLQVQYPLALARPDDVEVLTTIRRGFHTLKGSGRMVGLDAVGEASWAIEQTLNYWLAESIAVTPELLALLQRAATELEVWIDEIALTGVSSRSPAPFSSAAAALKHSGKFEWPGDKRAVADDAEVFAELPAVEDFEAVEAFSPEFDVEPAEPAVSFEMPVAFAENQSAKVPHEAPALYVVPSLPAQEAEPAYGESDDEVKVVGPVSVSLPLYNIYVTEADENLRQLTQDFAEWQHETSRGVSDQALRLSHTLAGSAATVGAAPVHDLAAALEQVLLTGKREHRMLARKQVDLLAHAVVTLGHMQSAFAGGEYPQSDFQLLTDLQSLEADLRHVPPPVTGLASGFAEVQAPVSSARDRVTIEPAQENTFNPFDGGSIEAIEAAQPDQTAFTPETAFSPAHAAPAEASPPAIQELPAAEPPVQIPAPIAELAPVELAALTSVVVEAEAQPDANIRDEIEPELFELFEQEATESLPAVGQALRTWQSEPASSAPVQALLRILHTLKGSARMAGALRIGQNAHEMETRIEQAAHENVVSPALFEQLTQRFDRMQLLFEVAQGRAPESALLQQDTPGAFAAAPATVADEAQAAAVPSKSGNAADLNVIAFPAPQQAAKRGTAAVTAGGVTVAKQAAPTQVGMVRVRADILDRLVNQAGEVSISRARVESEVGGIKGALTELTENVARLRSQLREIEIQAESQMESRLEMQRQMEVNFDPLEFDRFTRLQELTRLMAESVNDVATVQQNLNRSLVGTERDLTSQARLTRDLTQDLMRVRMVPFDSLSDRLYRVVRQAGRDTAKPVALDIRGGAVEVDRGVLERMVGPFEHLLRNAIAHGVESAEVRQQRGKGAAGQISIDVRQEGNEMRITFADDGNGLDLARIKSRAIEKNILPSDAAPSDQDLTDLIFAPGFSTATELTELSGRGVGMDVVRAESASLGGRISVVSDYGKGTQFTVFLPLTLAVTQVVLVRVGTHTVALPSVLVAEVQQVKAQMLAQVYNDGQVRSRGKLVQLHYLGKLLDLEDATPMAQRYSPIVVMAQGEDRTAVHVDEVIGNREVVVKNIGPQLARVLGISGATVLGSGEVVLIINPIPMAQRFGRQETAQPEMPSVGGAVAEILPADETPRSQPATGLQTLPVVMVVDDSLTVRRVSERLLTRAGYQVVLAKDGVDALRQLQDVTPDVMLVDIEMPRMDGFDLTRNVRGDQRYTKLPIIMITSRTADKHRNVAFELGVNVFLGKPFQDDELLGHIKGFVAHKTAAAV